MRSTRNYLLAQQKLVFKQRNGAKVTKRYDIATTPHKRAENYECVSTQCREQMSSAMALVRPGGLYRQIQTLTKEVERMALAKAPAPVKPRVNQAFNPSLKAEAS